MEVKTVQRTTNQDKKVVYFVPTLMRVFTNLADALSNAAQNIKDNCDGEILSRPVTFKTEYGYIVKCINNRGKDRVRNIFTFTAEDENEYFNGVMLEEWN